VLHIRGSVGKSRGGVERVGSRLRLTFKHNGTGCMLKELSMVPKPHHKAKQAVR